MKDGHQSCCPLRKLGSGRLGALRAAHGTRFKAMRRLNPAKRVAPRPARTPASFPRKPPILGGGDRDAGLLYFLGAWSRALPSG